MKAVLYIGHGSRVKEASEQAITFLENVMEKVDAPIQEIGFLELTEPSIEEAFKRCVEKGATTIIAVPILLLTAAHAKEDIPQELASVHHQFPHIEVVYGHPIGVHEDMTDILLERMNDTKLSLDNSMVLLVGRGSSDPDVKRDLTKIGEMFEQKSPVDRVEICFLTAAEPSFQQGLERAAKSGYQKVFVIPYLLFTGILMKTMEKTMKDINQHNNQQFILCQYLGYHEILENILVEQVKYLMNES